MVACMALAQATVQMQRHRLQQLTLLLLHRRQILLLLLLLALLQQQLLLVMVTRSSRSKAMAYDKAWELLAGCVYVLAVGLFAIVLCLPVCRQQDKEALASQSDARASLLQDGYSSAIGCFPDHTLLHGFGQATRSGAGEFWSLVCGSACACMQW